MDRLVNNNQETVINLVELIGGRNKAKIQCQQSVECGRGEVLQDSVIRPTSEKFGMVLRSLPNSEYSRPQTYEAQ